MSFSFFKSFGLGKLLRLNVSTKGLGVSLGPRGASISIGPSGTHLNVSPLPGSGIRFRTRLDKAAKVKPAPVLPAVLPTAHKYIGRKFIGDLGKGYDELVTIVDVSLEGGEPRIHVRFGESEGSYAYSLQRFGEKFGQMQEVM
jgi:hypothetical protein